MQINSIVIEPFQNPQYAAVQAAVLVFASGFSVYRLSVHFSKNGATQYWRWIAFLSEILVAVGLIGLLTFMGRTSIEVKRLDLAEAVSAKQSKLGREAIAFGGSCSLPLAQLTPFAGSGSVEKLCSGWKAMNSLYNPAINWESTRDDLFNVARSKDVNQEIGAQARKFAISIDEYLQARQALVNEVTWGEKIRPRASLVFLIVAALMAVLGVSMKCARAFNELTLKRPVVIEGAASACSKAK